MTDVQRLDGQPKGLAKVLLGLFTKQATVVDTKQLDERFRLLTLECEAFKGLPWTPGQKLQIMLRSAFVARTFTPMQWDTEAGRTRVLVYTHGISPTGDWIRGVTVGDCVHVFGPRPSLNLDGISSRVVLVGDETSIGLAYSLLNQHPNRALLCLLEVNTVENTRAVLARLAIGSTELFERRADDSHLEQIEHLLMALAVTNATFVMTGKASSIQRLRRTLKQLGVCTARMPTKAYWSPGKIGLD